MNSPAPSPRSQLLVLRIIWAALLIGELAFTAIVAFVLIPGRSATSIKPQPILTTVSFVMAAAVIPVTFIVRRATLKRAGGAPSAAAAMATYTTGNIIFWAGCEGVAFFGAVVAMLNASLWPTIVNVAIAALCQLVTFPTAMKVESLAASRPG
jgi:hypothetical protein